MKVAIFSDIHGNLTGLKAVLSQISRIGGIDKIFCAGDILGGGPGTDDLLDVLFSYRVQAVRGNHEEMALDIESSRKFLPGDEWDKWAFEYEWLRERISQKYWDWIASLPMYREVELESGKKLVLCHATLASTWERVCAPDVPNDKLEKAYGNIDADVVAYGHYHSHHLIWINGKMLLNVASVGLRKDNLSAFTVLEYRDGMWIVRQYQVVYDVGQERELARKKGFPTK